MSTREERVKSLLEGRRKQARELKKLKQQLAELRRGVILSYKALKTKKT